MVLLLQSDLRYSAELRFSGVESWPRSVGRRPARVRVGRSRRVLRGVLAAMNGNGEKKKCTADELHYVAVSNSDWHLALWRYLPSSMVKRNHPLLLLSGVGTNAIGFDLSPQSSFARFMSGQGFDTWILEVRGAGLSMPALHSPQPLNAQRWFPNTRIHNQSQIYGKKLLLSLKHCQMKFHHSFLTCKRGFLRPSKISAKNSTFLSRMIGTSITTSKRTCLLW